MKKLIPLLLFFVALPAMAARQFDIEVIVFKHDDTRAQINESWAEQLPEIDLKPTGRLDDANYRARKGVQLLPRSAYQLNPQEQALRQRSGYQVLLHSAWRQGDRGRLSAPIFHIQAGKNFAGQYDADGNPKGSHKVLPNYITDNVATTAPTSDSRNSTVYELDGRLQVYVEHYLYTDVMLDLKEPTLRPITVSSETPDQQGDVESQPLAMQTTDEPSSANTAVETATDSRYFLKSFRMDQKRRMRSGETHYFDHPKMGMIVQVRRVAE